MSSKLVLNEHRKEKHDGFPITSTIINECDDSDDFSSNSILEFLKKEHECFDNNGDLDVESIFEEINRLSDHTDNRSVDEILREAESLLKKQTTFSSTAIVKNNVNENNTTGCGSINKCNTNHHVALESNKNSNVTEDDACPESVLSQESTPRDLMMTLTSTTTLIKCVGDDDLNGLDNIDSADETSDNIDDITDGIESIGITNNVIISTPSFTSSKSLNKISKNLSRNASTRNSIPSSISSPSLGNNLSKTKVSPEFKKSSNSIDVVEDASSGIFVQQNKINSSRPPSSSGIFSEATSIITPSSLCSPPKTKTYCDKSTNSSPKHFTSVKTSPIIDNASITREYALKTEIDRLQEKLKDTEERLKSLRIQHDSLSQIHRDLRENHTHLQEESDMLKLDVQHLTECANVLRTELQSARNDRNEALEVQRLLQTELEESKLEKKKAQEQCEKDSKTIQDLQRQCKEMERILMRKHPDSVSALIVASKNSAKINEESSISRKLLEQRIAQLESDAKEQDLKAQKILANVQARFNSVQAKYETHIADLETQVLSLQEINAKLNEKIESQITAFNKFNTKHENLVNDFTQTDYIPNTNAVETKMSSTQTDPKLTSTISTSTMNVRQIPVAKKSNTNTGNNKISTSQSDSTITASSSSSHHATAREDAHLLATIRGMRVDLAIKEKAMQRLTRELDECKRTIKKLQREKEAMKNEKPHIASTSRKSSSTSPATESDSHALKDALSKIKILEFDYKSLQDKRLQDLKTLQAAHERELTTTQETVRVLKERLSERDENFSTQKRRKVPIDYYALKAKVSSLERRHSEREQRLHMLVEALSKGRLSGALEEILSENT